jgi:broad specificity phosphatase PhoE
MALHLVRHADAGVRPGWSGPDDLRPLTGRGRAQAERLADALDDVPLDQVLSSPALRCSESVTPLAERRGLSVAGHPALAEDVAVEDAWALLEELAATEAVLCSHGNVIGALLDRLHRRGVHLVADAWTCKKGSIWTLESEPGGGFRRACLRLEQA